MKKSAEDLLYNLNVAAAANDIKAISEIHQEIGVSGGIKLSSCGQVTKKTPLHWAAESNSLAAAIYLHENSELNVLNQQDVNGCTPLNLSTQSNKGRINVQIATIQYFLGKKANPIIADNKGITPLMAMRTLRNRKEVLNDSDLQASVRTIIKTMMAFVEQEAKKNNQTATIKKDGSVVFMANRSQVAKDSPLVSSAFSQKDSAILPPSSYKALSFIT